MMKSVLTTALMLFATLAVAHGDGLIVVTSVVSDGPAAAAGLQADDTLIAIDGQKISTQEDLQKAMAAQKPGDTVPITVKRKGETVDLTLTFGERPEGGALMGVSLGIGAVRQFDPENPDTPTVQCRSWLDERYRVETMMEDLGLDLSDDYEASLECLEEGSQGGPLPPRYCDNIFKVHCAGIDLLAEIAEAQVQRCEDQLSKSLGLRVEEYKGWKTCAETEVFDRYAIDGESSDADTCRSAFLDCGTNIDAAVKAGKTSSQQRGFVECCSADALDPANHNGSEDCGMIDDGFESGPCQERSVCVNRLTSEWLHCSALQ